MSRIKKIYLLLIIISSLIASYGIYARYCAERGYDRYEILINLQDLKHFASKQNMPYLDVAKNFLDAGIHTVLVDEVTLENLKQSEGYKLSVTYSGLDVNVHADKELLGFIENGIRRTMKDDRKIYYTDENTLTVEGRLSDLVNVSNQTNVKISEIERMGLGFVDSEIEALKNAGIRFALRPIYNKSLQDGKRAIDAYFSYILKYSPNQNFLLFGGSDIPGSPDNIGYLQEKLEEFQMHPVIIENGQQDGNFEPAGLVSLIKNRDYQAVRLFSTWTYIQIRYDYRIAGHHEGQEIINTYYRAITERNIRLIYFRFFLTPKSEYVTDMDIYKKRLSELEHRLYKNYGIAPVLKDGKYTPLRTMKPLSLSIKIKVFAILGTIVAYLLLAEEFIGKHKKIRYALWLLSSGLLFGSLALGRERTEQIFALLASIAFPTLSVVYLMKVLKSCADKPAATSSGKSVGKCGILSAYFKGMAHLLVCMAISFIGAIFVITLYAHSRYMLEFSKFVGVKASQMIPIFAVIIMYFVVFSLINQVKTLLNQNVKVWQILVGSAIVGILGIMLLRSGHTSNVEPPSFELWFRNFLELITPARPRTKAIFLGFPALIILVFLAERRLYKISYPIFLLAATIGQANLVNSFSHIRTPVIVSVYRISGEFVVSAGLALIVVLLCGIVEKIYQRIGRNA